MNNSPSVKEETAEQVRKAIEQLGGMKMASRRGRRGEGKKTIHNVAIVSLGQAYRPWFEIPVMAAVVSGITRAARAHNIAVQIDDTFVPQELAQRLVSRNVQGALVFLPSGSSISGVEAIAQRVPVVRVMGESMTTPAVDHVGPDNVAVGALALNYLLGHGCREIAFFATHPEWEFEQARAYGFMTAAQRSGLKSSPAMFILSQTEAVREYFGARVWVDQTLDGLMDSFAGMSPRPAGIFVPRDEEAIALYRALNARNIVPGKDVLVVSCDNEEVRLSALDPRPASIELGTNQIGRLAIERLLARIRNPLEPPIRIQATPSLATAPAHQSI